MLDALCSDERALLGTEEAAAALGRLRAPPAR